MGHGGGRGQSAPSSGGSNEEKKKNVIYDLTVTASDFGMRYGAVRTHTHTHLQRRLCTATVKTRKKKKNNKICYYYYYLLRVVTARNCRTRGIRLIEEAILAYIRRGGLVPTRRAVLYDFFFFHSSALEPTLARGS